MTETQPEAETSRKQTQLDNEPVALNRRSGRMAWIAVCTLTLSLLGAVAIYALPLFDIALPNYSSFAELFPRQTVSMAIPDPPVRAALKDIQAAQQRSAAALQENGAVLQQNTAMLQQDAAALDSFRQGFTAQQTNLKAISNQLSSLTARVDSLHNALVPLTTSSISQPNRARLVRTSRKKEARVPNKPVGPVSVGGAPLNPPPGPGPG